jgi:hypothetical protein
MKRRCGRKRLRERPNYLAAIRELAAANQLRKDLPRKDLPRAGGQMI